MEDHAEDSTAHGIEETDIFSETQDCDDPEKSLLFDRQYKGQRSYWNSRFIAKQAWITLFNAVLFLVSLLLFWMASRSGHLSTQDQWRATSYYCT